MADALVLAKFVCARKKSCGTGALTWSGYIFVMTKFPFVDVPTWVHSIPVPVRLQEPEMPALSKVP